jgi:hypothetical protein
MTRRLVFLASIASFFFIAGCREEGPEPPPADQEPLAAWSETADPLFVEASLDYSCLGTRTEPNAGAPVSTRFELRDFQDDFPVPGTEVWLFTNNTIADACAAPDCLQFTTDAMGNGTVQLPANAWYAYRVLPRMGLSRMSTVFAVFQYNEPAPSVANQAVVGNSVSGSTIDLIPALLGISRTSGLAIIAGRIEDCAGNFVENVSIRLFDPDGNEIVPGTLNEEPHFNYFNGNAMDNLPDQTQLYSNRDGLYVLSQITVADGRPYRVEAYGNLNGALVPIACESARIFPDAVTILNMIPLRGDAPAGCPTE